MRRPLCTSSPHVALAGQVGNWTFSFTPSETISKGTLLEFDLASFGTEGEWQIPALGDVTLLLPTKKPLAIKNSGLGVFAGTLPVDLKAGQPIAITLANTRAQLYLQRRRPFFLRLTPKGGETHSEQFLIDVRGNLLHHLQVIAPSFVQKNKRFDIVVRFEDAFGNLTHNAPEDTLIELSYEQLRENLSWKLFVPETGFVCLPNLYFNETGLFRIQLRNLKTGELFLAYPICCVHDLQKQLLWGMLQGDCDKVHPACGYDAFLRYFRDECALNFFSAFVGEEMSEEKWKELSHYVTEFNENERFNPFLSIFWHGKPKEEGARNLLLLKDQKGPIPCREAKYNTLKKLYKAFSSKELLSIPCLTSINNYAFDFNEFCPEFERVVEIYNGWEDGEKALQKILLRGLRFGFVAGALSERGLHPLFKQKERKSTAPGLTAVISKEHSRESIFEALSARSCYATTGEPILLHLQLVGQSMGSELSTLEKPGLAITRYLTGYVAGTTTLQSVELIRNGQVIHQFPVGESWSHTFELDDADPLDQVVAERDDGVPFVYYYLRAQQKDGHRAWSSPIWIDYHGGKVSTPKKPAKK